MGFVDPPLEFSGRGRTFAVRALNERGSVLLSTIERALAATVGVASVERSGDAIGGRVAEPTERLPEEQRSRQPTLFTVLRALVDLFAGDEDPHHGLYGAFGYDLVFQFEPLELRLERPDDQRDVVLYVPDEIVVVDHRREVASRLRYDFETPDGTTEGVERSGEEIPYT